MLPVLRQRLLLVGGVVLGGVVWMLVVPMLRAVDGSSGLVLLDARVGVVLGVVLAVVGGLVALALACGASAAGNPLAGPFVLAGALAIVAAAGGGVGGFFRRHVFEPGLFDRVIIEALLWLALWVGVLGVLFHARRRIRPRLPRRLRAKHGFNPEAVGLDEARFNREDFMAAGITCVAGYLLCGVAVRSGDVGQAVAGVALAFGVAAALAHGVVRGARPWLTLLTPMVVAVAAAGYMRSTAGSSTAIEAAYNVLALPGAALALPIHFASAGVGGAVLGAAAAQGMTAGKA